MRLRRIGRRAIRSAAPALERPDSSVGRSSSTGLAEAARGGGYATESLTELTDWALGQPDVDRVVARTLAVNTPSQAVLARAGFDHTAVDGEMQHWALTKGGRARCNARAHGGRERGAAI
jgi:hypothetical protein